MFVFKKGARVASMLGTVTINRVISIEDVETLYEVYDDRGCRRIISSAPIADVFTSDNCDAMNKYYMYVYDLKKKTMTLKQLYGVYDAATEKITFYHPLVYAILKSEAVGEAHIVHHSEARVILRDQDPDKAISKLEAAIHERFDIYNGALKTLVSDDYTLE